MSTKINESDIINLIHEDTKVAKKDIKDILNSLKHNIVDNIEQGKTVNIVNFASFKTIKSKEKERYSFKTKQNEVYAPATRPKCEFSKKVINKIKQTNK